MIPLLLAMTTGCHLFCHKSVPCVPRELATVAQPPYVIEPPDILVIDAIRLIPKPPYRVEPLDTLGIRVSPTPEDQPIAGIYTVEPEGTVNLGFTYGTVRVARMTEDHASHAVGVEHCAHAAYVIGEAVRRHDAVLDELHRLERWIESREDRARGVAKLP